MAYVKQQGNIRRVNLTLHDSIVKDIDKKAASLNLSRSAFISMCVTQYLNADKVLTEFPQMMQMLQKGMADLEELKKRQSD